MRTIKGRAAGVIAFVMLAGCASVDQDPSNIHTVQAAYDDLNVTMTELSEGFLRQGRIISVGNVAQIKIGDSRDRVQSLVGMPLPRSGNNHWFYDINIPLDGMDDYLVCQLRVSFDGQDQVSNVEWRRRQCQDRFAELTRAEPQHLSLSSDILFGYDSAELTAAGHQELDTAARVIAHNLALDRVHIVGHTDRIGSNDYNRDLSLRRANTVRSYLVSQGVPSARATTEGRGSAEPLIECHGNAVTESLKNCLRPNRRVHLTIHGTR